MSLLLNELSSRKIIHIDMDAFFTSVEQRDHPHLRGKPIVVGGSPDGRGVVAGASYEARKFGVRSAMSCKIAQRLCPELIFVQPRFEAYQKASDEIHQIFRSVTPLVEPLSLDEAYLDVTENLLNEPIASQIARVLKSEIRAKTGLTASAGVAPNKFLAKIASDYQKPDGLMVIAPHRIDEFLKALPVEKFWGVGPVTARGLHELGLRVSEDLRRVGSDFLVEHFGKFGAFLYDLSRGHDPRPVEADGERKSRGAEETFERDVLDLAVLRAVIADQAMGLAQDLQETECFARSVTLKVRYADFTTVTRSHTPFKPVQEAQAIETIAVGLLESRTQAGQVPVRLLGVSVSGLIGAGDPLQLWFEFGEGMGFGAG